MLKSLPQLEEVLVSSSSNPTDAIEYINSHIEKNSCEYLSVDISFMNVIDACYVSTLCSTKHFTKYPSGKISWKVSSESVEDFSRNLVLGNSQYIL